MIHSFLAKRRKNVYTFPSVNSFIMKTRASYTAEEKLKIIRAILTRKTSIQKVAREKGIAPTLISLWKKQAENAMLARFQPQPKGRKKVVPAVVTTPADLRALRNETRKAKIKAAHLESSLKDARARLAQVEDMLRTMVEAAGYKLVKIRRSRRSASKG